MVFEHLSPIPARLQGKMVAPPVTVGVLRVKGHATIATDAQPPQNTPVTGTLALQFGDIVGEFESRRGDIGGYPAELYR